MGNDATGHMIHAMYQAEVAYTQYRKVYVHVLDLVHRVAYHHIWGMGAVSNIILR